MHYLDDYMYACKHESIKERRANYSVSSVDSVLQRYHPSRENECVDFHVRSIVSTMRI